MEWNGFIKLEKEFSGTTEAFWDEGVRWTRPTTRASPDHVFTPRLNFFLPKSSTQNSCHPFFCVCLSRRGPCLCPRHGRFGILARHSVTEETSSHVIVKKGTGYEIRRGDPDGRNRSVGRLPSTGELHWGPANEGHTPIAMTSPVITFTSTWGNAPCPLGLFTAIHGHSRPFRLFFGGVGGNKMLLIEKLCPN